MHLRKKYIGLYYQHLKKSKHLFTVDYKGREWYGYFVSYQYHERGLYQM